LCEGEWAGFKRKNVSSILRFLSGKLTAMTHRTDTVRHAENNPSIVFVRIIHSQRTIAVLQTTERIRYRDSQMAFLLNQSKSTKTPPIQSQCLNTVQHVTAQYRN
jgi:hypothetical protein